MKRKKIFLLHFAGGNCYSFNFLKPLLTDFDAVALELPGRGKRFDEKLITDFHEAALDIYNQIVTYPEVQDCLIFGHSMGAYLALKVSSMLEAAGNPPAFIFVSGNAGPGLICYDASKPRHTLGRSDFRKELENMGGISNEILENEEAYSFFEPILRADFEIAENDGLEYLSPINVPIYALMGSEEKDVERIANWAKFTKNIFSFEILSGGHFFIYDQKEKVAEVILKNYKKLLPAI